MPRLFYTDNKLHAGNEVKLATSHHVIFAHARWKVVRLLAVVSPQLRNHCQQGNRCNTQGSI